MSDTQTLPKDIEDALNQLIRDGAPWQHAHLQVDALRTAIVKHLSPKVKCGDHNHQLEEIFQSGSEHNGSAIVRWCRLCGGVSIDLEVDGRLMHRLVKMKFPDITIEASNAQRQTGT